MKIFKRALLALIIVLGLAGSLALAVLYKQRHLLIRGLVEHLVSSSTGFQTEIGSLHHEFPFVATLHNVTMYNPPGFKQKIFARSSDFRIDIDFAAILRGTFHIRSWHLVIDELYIEKNKAGQVNGKLLKSIKKIGNSLRPGGGGAGGEDLNLLMDLVEVTIPRIDYEDLTAVLPYRVKKMSLKTARYEKVTDFEAMVDQIEDAVLAQAGPAKHLKLGPYYLDKTVKTVERPGQIVASGAGKLGEETARTLREVREKLARPEQKEKKETEPVEAKPVQQEGGEKAA